MPAQRWVLIIVASALFANMLALLGLTPLYPTVAHDLALGPDVFSIYFAIQGGINLLLQIPVGVIADRVGRRPVMGLGLVFMVTGQLLRWRSNGAIEFGAGQVFIGLCGPCVVAAGYSAVADAYQARGRAQAIGVLQVAINLGQAAGFILAGLLAPAIGWRGYSLVAAAFPAVLIPLIAKLPEPARLPQARALGRQMLAASRFLIVPGAAALAAAAALNTAAYSGSTYLLPFVARMHGVNASTTALFLLPILVGSITSGLVVGRWADRVGLRAPLLTAIGTACVGLAAFGTLGFSPVAVVVCYLAIGAGVSSTIALAAVAVVDLANARGMGTGAALGGLRVGQGLGPTLGPTFAGFMLVRASPSTGYYAFAVALLVAGILMYVATGARIRGVASTSAV